MARRLAPWMGAILAAAAGTVAAAAMFGFKPRGTPEPVEAVISDSWGERASTADPAMSQDTTQRECTRHADRPPDAVAVAIMQREWRSITYPKGAIAGGDWRRGEILARSGAAPRMSDSQDAERSGPAAPACAACHLLDRRDSSKSAGGQRTGPSLVGYGSRKTWSEQSTSLLYEQIYNSNAVIACSAMPRYGAQKLLSPDDIRDIVAYLVSPDSPVNRTVVTSADRRSR